MQWNFVVRPSADTAVVVVFMFFVAIIGGLGIRECRRDEEARQRQRAFEQTDLLTLTGSLAAVFEVPPHVRSYRIDYPAMVCQILYEREGKCAQWRYKPARQAAVTFSAPTLNLTEFRSAVIVRSISQERKTYVSETRKQDLYKIDKEVWVLALPSLEVTAHMRFNARDLPSSFSETVRLDGSVVDSPTLRQLGQQEWQRVLDWLDQIPTPGARGSGQ